MKIVNTGTADLIVKDKRGNSVRLEPSQMVEVSEETARRLRVYPFVKIVQEVKPKIEEHIEEPKVEPKKKSRKRKNGISNNDWWI